MKFRIKSLGDFVADVPEDVTWAPADGVQMTSVVADAMIFEDYVDASNLAREMRRLGYNADIEVHFIKRQLRA